MPSLAYSAVDENTKWFFQATFAAVTLASSGARCSTGPVRGLRAVRVLFVGLIYPIVVHWQWGGGWLFQHGYQDFAGSGIVHLCGATAAFAGAMIVGPRIGSSATGSRCRYRALDAAGDPRGADPLGRLAGVQRGLLAGRGGTGPRPGIVVTNLSGIFGVIGATLVARLLLGTLDIGMMGNGAIAGLGAIAGPCAFVAPWGGAVIGLVAGSLMVLVVLASTASASTTPSAPCRPRRGRDRRGDRPRLPDDPLRRGAAGGARRPCLRRRVRAARVAGRALGAIASFTFVTSFAIFSLIHRTIGLRAPEDAELQGLDIVEHGMYGYPERFIEVPGATPDDALPDYMAAPAGAATADGSG